MKKYGISILRIPVVFGLCLLFFFTTSFGLGSSLQTTYAKTRIKVRTHTNNKIQAVPSPNCIGSGNSICNPSPSTTVNPTSQTILTATPSTDPCNTVNAADTAQAHSKKHAKHGNGAIGGSMQQLIALLLQLLNQLFSQLGLTLPVIGTPTPIPTQPVVPTTPIDTTAPTTAITDQPTTNPCPSATAPVATTQPTTGVTTPPAVTGTVAPTQPTSATMWKPTSDKPIQLHWQLTGKFNPATDFVAGATVYDIDGEAATTADVAAIHAKGYKAICYFDAGVYEDYRSDASSFPKSVIGNADTGWKGSFWLDIRQISILKPIMENRVKNWCQAKGFDAVEPDETEVWDNNPGFPITQADNIAYGQMIADIVHAANMSVGLKGNNAEAASYSSFTDWSLSEQCYEYSECDNLYNAFASKNKAVWIVEYNVTPNCTDANTKHMNAMKRDLNLVGPTASGYLFQPCKAAGSTSW